MNEQVYIIKQIENIGKTITVKKLCTYRLLVKILWRIALWDSGFCFPILSPVLINNFFVIPGLGDRCMEIMQHVWQQLVLRPPASSILFCFSRCFALFAKSTFNLRFLEVKFCIVSIFASASWNSNLSCVSRPLISAWRCRKLDPPLSRLYLELTSSLLH